MKRFRFTIIAIVLAVGLFVFGYGSAASVSPAAPKYAAATAQAASPDWQKRWDSLVTDAKKEGRVMVYLGESPPAVRSEVTKAFKEKYGITVDFMTGRATEVSARLQAEKTGGSKLLLTYSAPG